RVAILIPHGRMRLANETRETHPFEHHPAQLRVRLVEHLSRRQRLRMEKRPPADRNSTPAKLKTATGQRQRAPGQPANIERLGDTQPLWNRLERGAIAQIERFILPYVRWE